VTTFQFVLEADRYHFFETDTDIFKFFSPIQLATDTDIPKFA